VNSSMNENGLTENVNVRFSKRDLELLSKVAESRRENVSVFIRRAVMKYLAEMRYLSEEEKKALGI